MITLDDIMTTSQESMSNANPNTTDVIISENELANRGPSMADP